MTAPNVEDVEDVEDAEHGHDADEGPVVGPWPRALKADDGGSSLLDRTSGAWRELTRRELGLPTDVRLIGSGHQATFWHPGVAMKLVAADEMARLTDSSVWHLVVDSDAHPMGTTAMPVRDADGTLHAKSIEIAHDATLPPDMPTGRRPALTVPADENQLRAALPSVDAGVAQLRAALRDQAHAPDAALQVTHAVVSLLAPLLSAPPTIVRSFALLSTTFGTALLAKMRADPQRCAESYNRAVTAEHGAGTELAIGDRIELPLWRLDARGVRHRAFADDLDASTDRLDGDESVGSGTILPRALLVTAIVRLVAADHFIHGTGGMSYDVAMERWLGDWLGVAPRPASLVTATLRLPLPERDVPADVVARAIAAQRRRWWDPQRFVQTDAAVDAREAPKPERSAIPEKQLLVDAIAAAPRNSHERAERYRALHRRLAELRERAAPEIEQARRAVDDARRLAAGRPVATSRTWPFAFHAPEAIAELAAQTRAAVREV